MSSTLTQTRRTTTKQTTNPLTRWLLPSALIVGGVLSAALIGTTFGTPSSGYFDETMTKALTDSRGRSVALPVETMKIVPASSLQADLSWSPRTGDGSN
jgi:hypothetical protein